MNGFPAHRRCTALVLLALALGGCSSSNATDTSDEPVDRATARQVFQQTCRACHSLADADAAGTFGPDLDQLQPDAERVREQIESGGGGMPEGLLKGDQADLVARYVAEVAATPEDPATRAAADAAQGADTEK